MLRYEADSDTKSNQVYYDFVTSLASLQTSISFELLRLCSLFVIAQAFFFFFATIAAVTRFYSYGGDGIETAAGSCKKRTKRELISSDFLPDVFPELKNKTAQKKRNGFRTLAEGTERQRP